MFGWLRKLFGSSSCPPFEPTDTSGGLYSGLRHRALSIRRAEVGIAAPSTQTSAWGVLMESGSPGGTATLLALIDGTTSLYLSSGGGVIGGEMHEAVRDANSRFIEAANSFIQHLKPTEFCPVPSIGDTVFYILTDSGVLTGSARVEDLLYCRHPLAPLFGAGHEVLTQLRLISPRR